MRHHETIFSPDFLPVLTLCAGISMELLPFEPLNSLAEEGCQEKTHFPEDMAESKRRGTKQKLGANLKQTTSYCFSPGKCELTNYSSQNPGGSLENVGSIRKRGAVACSLPHLNSKIGTFRLCPLGKCYSPESQQGHLSSIRNPKWHSME